MNTNYQITILLDVPNVRLFQIKGQQSNIIHSGTLQVLESQSLNLTFLKLDTFQYALQLNIPVMIQLLKNGSTMYIMPGLEDNFYGIIVPEIKDVSEVFDFILSNRTQLVKPKPNQEQLFNKSMFQSKSLMKQIPEKDKIPNTQLMNKSGVELLNVNLWAHVGEGEKKAGIGEYIQKGGNLVRDGLIAAAGYLGSGIKMGGQYIAGQVTTSEETQISDSTKNKMQLVNTGTKAIVIFTKAQVEALINLGQMIGTEAAKQFGDSETGKKMQDHRYYNDAKEVGTAAVYACVSIYDGLTEALCVLIGSTGQATTDVIKGKYGEQAGDLSKQGFEIVGNVMELDRVYVQVAAKKLLEAQQKEQQQKQ